MSCSRGQAYRFTVIINSRHCRLGHRTKAPKMSTIAEDDVGLSSGVLRKSQEYGYIWVGFGAALCLISAAAAVRVSTPNFMKICSRCLFTVRGFMPRISLISRLVLPWATQVRTSDSRWVNEYISATRSVPSRESSSSNTTRNSSRPTLPRKRALKLLSALWCSTKGPVGVP
jgi:hypothetical protein